LAEDNTPNVSAYRSNWGASKQSSPPSTARPGNLQTGKANSVRIDDQQRGLIEARIRSAMDRLLRGDLAPGDRCDVKTLAREAAVSRAALYSTYAHLKTEFEQRRERLRDSGTVVDPRQSQITNLKDSIEKLRHRLSDHEDKISKLSRFRTTALSQLAAQHDEIQRLRSQLSKLGNVRVLRPAPSQNRNPS
jgi:predicted nuclease with TOPRIM domain